MKNSKAIKKTYYLIDDIDFVSGADNILYDNPEELKEDFLAFCDDQMEILRDYRILKVEIVQAFGFDVEITLKPENL